MTAPLTLAPLEVSKLTLAACIASPSVHKTCQVRHCGVIYHTDAQVRAIVQVMIMLWTVTQVLTKFAALLADGYDLEILQWTLGHLAGGEASQEKLTQMLAICEHSVRNSPDHAGELCSTLLGLMHR